MLNIHHLESFYYVARFGGLTHASLPSSRARAQNRFHSATAQRTEMQLETAGERLGFLRHYLSVLPDVNRGPVSLRSLSCRSGRTPEGATDGCGETDRFGLLSVAWLHDICSRICGDAPELSYTAHMSASALYVVSKFRQPRWKRRSTSARGTS